MLVYVKFFDNKKSCGALNVIENFMILLICNMTRHRYVTNKTELYDIKIYNKESRFSSFKNFEI